MPGIINVNKQLEKGNNYREISGKFGVVNTTDTGENLFRTGPYSAINSSRVYVLILAGSNSVADFNFKRMNRSSLNCYAKDHTLTHHKILC